MVDCISGDFLSHWTAVASNRKPIIAAVNGYAVSAISVFIFHSDRKLLYQMD